VDKTAFFAFVDKFHDTVNLGKQCIVFAASHIITRFKDRTTLPDQDASASNKLAGKPFNP
jgi:hypothetical protein